MSSVDKTAIDELTAAFFDAFTNCGGAVPHIDALYDLFMPGALIVKNVGGVPETYDTAGFIEPRRSILTDGSLVEFREREVSETTEIFGNVAQRFSRYEKSWIAAGQSRTGSGVKSIQFVRSPGGWKISALAWDDE